MVLVFMNRSFSSSVGDRMKIERAHGPTPGLLVVVTAYASSAEAILSPTSITKNPFVCLFSSITLSPKCKNPSVEYVCATYCHGYSGSYSSKRLCEFLLRQIYCQLVIIFFLQIVLQPWGITTFLLLYLF